MAAYIVAAVGSGLIRVFGESDINEKTTAYLAKQINVEKATRIVSKNVGYYLPMVTIKAACDLVVASGIGRGLYALFKKLWGILNPLFESSRKAFMNGIKKSFDCIQQSARKLLNKCSSFHTICDKVFSKSSITNVIQALDCIQKIIVCAKTGFCRIVQFELTKYYLEIRGLLRALCKKFNINFLKYVPKADEESNSDEIHLNGKQKDEPLRYTFEISLEQLLYGTESQLQITRKIREINRITETERRTYTIKIEAGCKEEHIIRLAEVGDRDPINIPADLLITIRSKPHLLYKRQGADLIYTKVISYVASRSNNPIQIPLLDGNTASVVPGGIIYNNTELVVPGHGLPNPDNAGARGRLLVRFDVQAPTNQIYCGALTITETIRESVIDQYD